MDEFKIKEIKTFDYERPAIQKEYANQTLHVNLSGSEISIKPVGKKWKKVFVDGPEYKRLKDAVYKRIGWTENDIPTIETVKRLGIDFPDVLDLLKK